MRKHKAAGLGKMVGLGVMFAMGACAQERFDVAERMRSAYGRMAAQELDAGRASAIYAGSVADGAGAYATAVGDAALSGIASLPDTTRVRVVATAMHGLNRAYSFGICQNLR